MVTSSCYHILEDLSCAFAASCKAIDSPEIYFKKICNFLREIETFWYLCTILSDPLHAEYPDRISRSHPIAPSKFATREFKGRSSWLSHAAQRLRLA